MMKIDQFGQVPEHTASHLGTTPPPTTDYSLITAVAPSWHAVSDSFDCYLHEQFIQTKLAVITLVENPDEKWTITQQPTLSPNLLER